MKFINKILECDIVIDKSLNDMVNEISTKHIEALNNIMNHLNIENKTKKFVRKTIQNSFLYEWFIDDELKFIEYWEFKGNTIKFRFEIK